MSMRPGLVARAPARWPTLRDGLERLNTALRPRFVSLLVLLGASIAGLTIVVTWLAG